MGVAVVRGGHAWLSAGGTQEETQSRTVPELVHSLFLGRKEKAGKMREGDSH